MSGARDPQPVSGRRRPAGVAGRRVAVLSGGPGEERAVSLESGEAVSSALEAAGLVVRRFVIGESIDPILAELAAWAEVVFIALHGRYGEDGQVQRTLEAAGLTYTGSGPEASRAAMCKPEAKILFQAAGVPTPKYEVVRRELAAGAAASLREGGLAPPLVVKPSASGSSIGVSLVRTWEALDAALAEAYAYGDEVLVEKYVSGRELTVGVLDGEVLPVVELATSREFFDYQAKYSDGMTRVLCPAPLRPELAARAAEAGLRAFKAVGARDFGRVDMILDEAGTPQVLEVNTIPGFTSHSLLPKAAAAAGIDFEELVSRIVARALERSRGARSS